MKFWMAREKSNSLYIHKELPKYHKTYDEWVSSKARFRIDSDLFLEVTFENSPKEVELKLVEE